MRAFWFSSRLRARPRVFLAVLVLSACQPSPAITTSFDGAVPPPSMPDGGAPSPTPGLDGGVAPGLDSGPAPTTDAGPTEPTPPSAPCAVDGSPEVAVVAVMSQLGAATSGQVAVFALNGGGVLRDTGLRFAGVNRPQEVAIHPDGTEAVVTWGGSSSGHGFMILNLAPDGSSASVSQTTTLDGSFGSLYVSYSSRDSINISRVGPGEDNLLLLTRQPDGSFATGPATPVPGEFPQESMPIPGRPHEGVVLQAGLSAAEGGSLIPYNDSSGTVRFGEPLSIPGGLLFAYMNPVSPRIYLPAVDRVASNPGDPAGQFLMATPIAGSSSWIEKSPHMMLEYATVGGIAPSGEVALFVHPEYVGSGSSVSLNGYQLNAYFLDSQGVPSGAQVGPYLEADLVEDIEVSRHLHAVISYGDSGANLLGSMAYDSINNAWVQCPSTIALPGPTEIAIVPR